MMSRFVRQSLLALVVVAVAGCSGLKGSSVAGGDDKAAPAAEAPKYAITIRVLPYTDERKVSNPRKIGIGA